MGKKIFSQTPPFNVNLLSVNCGYIAFTVECSYHSMAKSIFKVYLSPKEVTPGVLYAYIFNPLSGSPLLLTSKI